MYDGYAWLTNLAPSGNVVLRIGLVAGMAAFLLLAVAIPDAFGGSGMLFGFAYLAVVLIHYTLFVAVGQRGSARAMLRVLPFNLAGTALLIAAGYVTGPADWVLFSLALVALVSNTLVGGSSGFDLAGPISSNGTGC